MKLSGRLLIPLTIFGGAFYFLFSVRHILLPFILAATLAYLLKPLVDFFVVHGLRRSAVVIAIYGAMLVGLAGGVYLTAVVLTQEAAKAALKMPQYVQKGQLYFQKLQLIGRGESHQTLEKGHPLIQQMAKHTDIIGSALGKAKSWPSKIVESMPSIASHLLPILELVFLVPFICFFLMMEGPALIDKVFQWIPARYVEMSLNMLVEVDYSLGNYIRGLSLEALVVGITAFAGFWAIGLDYSFQIAIVVGLANLIPYVGPIVGALLGGAVAVFQWGTVAGVVKVLCVCGAIRFIEDWFFQPLILKRAVHLHPVLIVFSLMAGTTLWGFWGLLFGVPVACAVKVLLNVVVQWYRSEYGNKRHEAPSAMSHIPLI
jgi:predicted PurR-regulated permease PerM